MDKIAGGPAFPTNVWIDENRTVPMGGMSLRDWFAGQALAGVTTATNKAGEWQFGPNSASAFAYEIADAMLREREKS